MEEKIPSKEFIDEICKRYGDMYDDRISEEKPGEISIHKSLNAFQQELRADGIELSTSKIRKILITGKCWSTAQSRKINEMFKAVTEPKQTGDIVLSHELAIKYISNKLHISKAAVSMYLPYQSVVYNLEKKSKNAIRCETYKKKVDYKNLKEEERIVVDSLADKGDVSEALSRLQTSIVNINPDMVKAIVDASKSIDVMQYKEKFYRLNKNMKIMMERLSSTLPNINSGMERFYEGFSKTLKSYINVNPLIATVFRLGKLQYVVWNEFTTEFYNDVIRIQTDDALIKFLSENVEKYEWLSTQNAIDLLKERDEIKDNITFNQSLIAYESGNYNLCVMGITALIDRLLSYYSEDEKATSIRVRYDRIVKKLEKKGYETLDSEEVRCMNLFISYSASIKEFGRSIPFDHSEPDNLNRHWIMHGRTNKKMTRFDCIRVIRLLYGTILMGDI